MPRQSDVSSLLLGVPAFALAFAITTVSVLVPLTLERLAASPALIGVVVAGEGLIALVLPLWIGPLSDRTRSSWGGRLPYVMLGAALCAPALAALPFVRSIASVMTISYTLVAQAGPAQSPGASAGWYELSRGVGVIGGPIVTGAAIDLARPLFASTQGYAAMWLVQALALLVSLPLVPRPRGARDESPVPPG